METVQLPEYFSTTELQAMSAEELGMAQANGFRKDVSTPSGPAVSPVPPPVQARPAAEVWGATEYDFTCPSGAQCRMRKIMPEKMLETGILDKIAVLPGYAQEVIEKTEAVGPPQPERMPTKEEIGTLVDVLDTLIPMVVVQPWVSSVPKPGPDGVTPERVEGIIYVDSIDLDDRVAIMERAIGGANKLRSFR
jgi:hypothetical protein